MTKVLFIFFLKNFMIPYAVFFCVNTWFRKWVEGRYFIEGGGGWNSITPKSVFLSPHLNSYFPLSPLFPSLFMWTFLFENIHPGLRGGIYNVSFCLLGSTRPVNAQSSGNDCSRVKRFSQEHMKEIALPWQSFNQLFLCVLSLLC